MGRLNGNVPNVNLGLSIGVISLLVFAVIVGGYYIDETKKTTVETKKLLDIQNDRVNTFIDNWEKRVEISNKINNSTQNKLLGLATDADSIFKQQITNEQNILGNLTDHRLVANFTRDQIISLENQTTDILYKTNELIQTFNQTNEDERVKAVDNIIKTLHEDHEAIKKILNGTK